MEQLLGVNVEALDAADESGKVEMLKGVDAIVPYDLTVEILSGNFEAKVVSVTAVLPVEEDNRGATAGDMEPASKRTRN